MEIVIRRGTADDLPAIAAIQSESAEASQWLPDTFLVAEALQNAGCDTQVAAFLVVREVAGGEYEILNVAVAHEFRRRGIAAALVGHALHEWPGLYFLEVREANLAARRLYAKLGFEQCGARRRYYTDPDDNAIVMRIRS